MPENPLKNRKKAERKIVEGLVIELGMGRKRPYKTIVQHIKGYVKSLRMSKFDLHQIINKILENRHAYPWLKDRKAKKRLNDLKKEFPL